MRGLRSESKEKSSCSCLRIESSWRVALHAITREFQYRQAAADRRSQLAQREGPLTLVCAINDNINILLRSITRNSITSRSDRGASLIFPIVALHRIQQFIGVVSGAILEDNLDIFDIRDPSGRITFHHDEVCVLSSRDPHTQPRKH